MIPFRLAIFPTSQLEGGAESGRLREIADFLHQFVVAAFDPYRPELHYMRGPGPACRARQALSQ